MKLYPHELLILCLFILIIAFVTGCVSWGNQKTPVILCVFAQCEVEHAEGEAIDQQTNEQDAALKEALL